jgi:hypothetical protein
MFHVLAKLHRSLALVSVCGAVGMMANFLFLVAPFLLIDGPRSQEWLHTYGSHHGVYFVCVTAVLGIPVFPFAKKLRTS